MVPAGAIEPHEILEQTPCRPGHSSGCRFCPGKGAFAISLPAITKEIGDRGEAGLPKLKASWHFWAGFISTPFLARLGGLLGWMLFGVFGDLNVPDDRRWLIWLLGGALIGGAIGYLVVSVEAIRDRSLVRFCRLASYGVVLGAAGGAVGMLIGEEVNFALVGRIGRTEGATPLLAAMLARGLGWLFLGVAVGIGEGVAARSLGMLSYGTVGGAIGGFIGGALFGGLYLGAIERGAGELSSA